MNQNKWLESIGLTGDPFGFNPSFVCRYSISENMNTTGSALPNSQATLMNLASEPGSKLLELESDQHQSFETTPIQIVGLMLNDHLFGVEIESVREIVVPAPITRVPHTPDFVRGVMNLRGTITPVIDLNTRFDLTASTRDSRTRIIILAFDEQTVGFVVDAVTEIYSVWPADIEAGSGISVSSARPYMKGIVNLHEYSHADTGDLLILLDLKAIAQGISDVSA